MPGKTSKEDDCPEAKYMSSGKLPARCKFTKDMTPDQKLQEIEDRKEEMLNKVTRKKGIELWADKELTEQIRDFMVEFQLSKEKAGPKFKVSTEFKTKLNVPNPHIDDLRDTLKAAQVKIAEADEQIDEVRKNIADVCEISVEDIDGELGDLMRSTIAKGPPRVKTGPTYVPPHLLAKGWKTMYTEGMKNMDDGLPYYVHVMRQLSQWDAPDKETQADPPTPPGTPDPQPGPIHRGWFVKIKERDEWEVFVDSRHWKKDIAKGVPSRAQRIKMLLDRMSTEEAMEKATGEVYGTKRKYRHEHPDAQWDENGKLIYVKPEKEKKEEKEDAEAEDGEGDNNNDEEEEDESSSEDEDIAVCQKDEKEYIGEKIRDIFDEDILKHMPRKLNAKSGRVKFEFPRGHTPPPTPKGSDKEDDDGDADAPADDGGGSESDDFG